MTVGETSRDFLSYTHPDKALADTRCYPNKDCLAPWGQVFRYRPAKQSGSGVIYLGW